MTVKNRVQNSIRGLLIDPETRVVRCVNLDATLDGICTTLGARDVRYDAVLTLGEPALVFSNRAINATPQQQTRVSVIEGLPPLAGRILVTGVADGSGTPTSFDMEPADFIATLVSFTG
jgi:hypothetical protein